MGPRAFLDAVVKRKIPSQQNYFNKMNIRFIQDRPSRLPY